MSDELTNQDIDLTGVDLSRPLLPRQTLRCRTGEVRIEQVEGRGRNVVVPLTLEEPGQDTQGRAVNVGFAVTDRILIDPTGGLTQEMIKERLARLRVAALRLDARDAANGPFRCQEITGREVLVTFDVRSDKQDPSKQWQDVKRYSAVKA